MRQRETLRQFDPVEPIEWPDRLSQTLLSRFDKCPRSAYLYLAYRGGKASHPMDRGTAFHIFAERATQLIIDNGERSLPPELGLEILDEILADAALNLVVPEQAKDELRAMVWNWCSFMWLDPSTIISVERMFEVEIAGWPIVGKIDLALNLGGAIIDIRDYKTSFSMADQQAIDHGFQGLLYLIGVAFGRWVEVDEDRNVISRSDEIIGAGINRFRFSEIYPLTTWEAEGTLGYREVVVDRDQLVNKRRSLEGMVANLEQRLGSWDFPARDGSWCATCPAKWECPIPEKARAWEGRIETVEDARKAAEKWIWAKDEANELWKGIKAFAEDHGRLRFGGDRLLEWKPVTSTKRLTSQPDLEAAIARAIETGETFEFDQHFKDTLSVRYTLRKLTPDELAAEAGEE